MGLDRLGLLFQRDQPGCRMGSGLEAGCVTDTDTRVASAVGGR